MRRLIIRPGAIGDLIVSLPALEHLKAGYTEVWAPARNLSLIRFADRTRSIASTGLDLVGVTESDLAALREFDSIVSWYGTNRPEFRALTAALGLPMEFLPALPPEGAEVHAVDFYLRQVGAPPGVAPRVVCPVERRDFAVIHPFSGSVRKNWPLAGYRELARRLPFPVAWCAGPEEELPGAVRFDDLYELACWLASARLFIGNDAGITHLAAAAGTPVIAIFGPTDPAVWAPRGDSVRVVRMGPHTMEQVIGLIGKAG
jgi:ADP-heptose:LPS heptosyltransferase